MGLNDSGMHFVQVYWIMGRSENSRNRIFVAEGGRLSTAPADVTKVEDPSLIIYNAMTELSHSSMLGPLYFIVSNGSQTDTVAIGLCKGESAYERLLGVQFEPDEPNFTPRITGVFELRRDGRPSFFSISIVSKAPGNYRACHREFFTYEVVPDGVGYCVTTYDHDAAEGRPLPSFSGKPYPVPLVGSPKEIAESFWDPEAGYFRNLVALAVKQIDLRTGASEIAIVNKYSAVPAVRV